MIPTHTLHISQNIVNYVSLKLTPLNFLLKKTQMLNVFESYDLQGFITGESQAPPECVTDEPSTL